MKYCPNQVFAFLLSVTEVNVNMATTYFSGQQQTMTEFRQPIQVQSHLEMPGILVQLGHIQHT